MLSADPRRSCCVCQHASLHHLLDVGDQFYWRCQTCQCTLLDPSCRLPAEAEKAVYQLHDNDPGDAGYRNFLEKLATPLVARLESGSRGLDFGCGPGPALAGMLESRGLSVRLYDPFFQTDEAALTEVYDFITCTEVLEHLHEPHETLCRLDRLLKPGGVLGVMTCFQTDDARFANWHYRRDPTHVVFYREFTMSWIARHFGWQLEIPAKDVAIFHKPATK